MKYRIDASLTPCSQCFYSSDEHCKYGQDWLCGGERFTYNTIKRCNYCKGQINCGYIEFSSTSQTTMILCYHCLRGKLSRNLKKTIEIFQLRYEIMKNGDWVKEDNVTKI